LKVLPWCRVLFWIALLSASGCGTPDDALLPAPLSEPSAGGATQITRTSAVLTAPATSTAGKTTLLEGTGRFIGIERRSEPHEDSAAGAEGITLNLVNVPTAQAAKTILGDLLSVRYTVDSSIKGEVTVQTPKPATKKEIVALFQSALRGQ
jgi:type II secretory pathway component GspD/PulD (secretin)